MQLDLLAPIGGMGAVMASGSGGPFRGGQSLRESVGEEALGMAESDDRRPVLKYT